MENLNNDNNTDQFPKSFSKFSSQFLNRPFSSFELKGQIIKEEIVNEEEENEPKNFGFNMTNYQNRFLLDLSTSTIKNSDLISSQNSISFNKKEIISQIQNPKNEEVNNNSQNILSSSISSFKKRKPFEKLSFHSESQTNLKEDKTDQSTISENINTSMLNKSSISDQEKSMILASYKLLSKEILEKAKLFNGQYKSSTPFWIKFFEEIENDTLKSNSSYYKVQNKSEYVKNLIEMVQRDADLYDQVNKNKKRKEETQNSIKQILQENQKEKDVSSIENQNNNSTQLEKSTNKESNISKDKNENDIEEQLVRVLSIYDKLDEKNKKLYSNEGNYDSFKFKLITGGNFTSEQNTKANKEKELIEMQRKREEEEKQKKEEQKMEEKNKVKEYKTIDTLYFGDNYTYEDLNYDKIDFCVYEKNSIKRLLELDRKLHEIDPERYKTSINTELKKLQDDFNNSKAERFKKIEMETREKFLKEFKEKPEKRSIFDIKTKDETKIQYKDYLKEFAERKKEKKALQNRMDELDNRIKELNKKEVSQVKKNKIMKELENYHQTNEYKEKFDNVIVPGKSQLEKVQKEIEDFEKRNAELMKGLDDLLNQIQEEKNTNTIQEMENEDEVENDNDILNEEEGECNSNEKKI